MKRSKARPTIRPQVLEEAAGWLVEFRAGNPDADQRRSFDAWLRTSPEHVRAYLTLLPVWENETFRELDLQLSPDALIQLARAPDDNLVRLSREARGVEELEPKGRVRRFAVAATLVSVGVAGFGTFSAWRNPVYATDIGEQTTVNLPDGTTVNLNSRTRIKLRYSEHERRVELQRGQALFQVARDAQRPFVVDTDDTQIHAVGTQFDIYKKPSATVVTVVEGRVAVSTSDVATTGVEAGQQLIVDTEASAPLATATPTRVNVKAATAWIQNRLIFSATPLPEVAEEFNRYNARQLIIDDHPELQSFRINGVFSSASPSSLLAFLREQPGMVITESDRQIHVSKK